MDTITVDALFELSDLTNTEYAAQLEKLQQTGQSQLFMQMLMARSRVASIRNTQRPPGELYAPVLYNKDYMIKLVSKAHWGGWILALTVWDLFVVDIDNEVLLRDASVSHTVMIAPESLLEYIKRNIDRHYPRELFYIHQTRRGYHLYLVSKPLSHSSTAAIFMRAKLGSDPAHATNSLYTGPSIRLSRKNGEDPAEPLASRFLCKHGQGLEDETTMRLYRQAQTYIKQYGKYYPADIIGDKGLMAELYQQWCQMPRDFGRVHIEATAPYLLGQEEPELQAPFRPKSEALTELVKDLWSAFIKYRVARIGTLPYLLLESHRIMGGNNLYRILEATPDYAYGIHLQECLYFISYRDLFYVDWDNPKKLRLLYQYVRYHPEATFRVVQTARGYHVFLTSYPIDHKSCISLAMRLCTDHCHMLSVYHRGYSVRVNQKNKDERPYRELRVVGRAPECPRLVALYQRHLELYQGHLGQATPVHYHQQKTATRLLQEHDAHVILAVVCPQLPSIKYPSKKIGNTSCL